MSVAPSYFIAIRENPKGNFILKVNEGGTPKQFFEKELVVEYAKAVTEYGRGNVVVGEVVGFRFFGHVEKIKPEDNLSILLAGSFTICEKTAE